ncbi:hypothetical protein B0A52_08137 [Exophiala mesophila]|uniref:F-box domain-containing protein n=1 Tax=Exophiala mesophila TaxID=212818 RepID=A0A438MV24_EXOME|nr:hypothetical protein B0A52_08137 [Exophiala mesophila]
MQSAPSEVSQLASSLYQTQSSSPPSQHGFPRSGQQTSGGSLYETSPRESSLVIEDTDSASVSSSSTRRGRSSNIARISSRDTSSQDASPGSRIDDYERQHARYRKPSDGGTFQVVPSTNPGPYRVSINDFPNEVLTHILSHLPPENLSSMSLISRRFHRLVTTPPAWRIAFARYFPGSESVEKGTETQRRGSANDVERTQRRTFTRLSALASWRSEYILRTRLLRSLVRGRPAIESLSRSSAARHSGSAAVAAVTTYPSGLYYPISHLHATFGTGLNKKQPLFMHGAVEQGLVSTSEPGSGKAGSWGLADFEGFKHFADQFPGESPYGVAPGNVVGMSNVMDVSQPYGRVYGEACPGGRLFYTSTTEQRGRFVSISSAAHHELGIPEVTMLGCAVTAVWMAKSEAVLKFTNGLFGFLAGFSNGVLSAYALGVNPVQDRRLDKGEPTAKWALCPGVPIIAISIDDKVSARRTSGGRVWAVVLNALGEVFYLNQVPMRPDFVGKASPQDIDRLGWQTGRSVEWRLVEATRRSAKPDPYGTAQVDGSYSPRTSSDAAGLRPEQLVAEAIEVERFIVHKPKHYQSVCEGWDMRRKLLVDFGGDDHHGAGESVFVIACGLDGTSPACVQRFIRCRSKVTMDYNLDTWPTIEATVQRPSIFGNGGLSFSEIGSPSSPRSLPRSRTSSQDDPESLRYKEEWRTSTFSFADHRNLSISAAASDDSEFALLAAMEDPILGMSAGSNSSSLSSPFGQALTPGNASDIPGHRARLFGIGTMSGVIMLWNMRASLPSSTDVVNIISPVRIIYTKSPQIASLAMTSLYVVHGGNEGLVQAWDPLGSSNDPVRTLNSRFSDRARRRIAQAEASVHGVGNNYFAAGAITLDPDPTVLRGIVSLGAYLRYWSYSSNAAESYKSRKRGQLRRRSERGSNSTPASQKVSATGRGLLKDYISNERFEMERDKLARQRENQRLTGRYGTNLLGEGASEEELLAYATMLSEEAFSTEEAKRSNEKSTSAGPAPAGSKIDSSDPELEEAIRLSLLESSHVSPSPGTSDFDVPIRFTRTSKHGTPSRKTKSLARESVSSPSGALDQDDFEFALQLSLAEEESRRAHEEEFPALTSSRSSESDEGAKGKGKGRSKHG